MYESKWIAKDNQDALNLNRAGDVAKRSPLIALANIKPALWTRSHKPFPGLLIPRFQAETILAIPTTTQYAIVKATDPQNMATAAPYGSLSVGSKGVVSTSIHNISLLKVSTALKRVVRVVRERPDPHGI